MKNFKKISLILMFTFLLSLMSTMPAHAKAIEGEHYTKEDAYNMGYYNNYSKSITIKIPEDKNQFWASFKLPKGKHIYTSCSYHDKYEGMTLFVDGIGADNDVKYSPEEVIDVDTILPFMAVDVDNTGPSDRTYYVRVTKPENVKGLMVVSISLNKRIYSANRIFDFTGRAQNSGNSYYNFSYSGVDSSVISVDLTDDNDIPDEAIVTHIETESNMSPSQGNVHHMLKPNSSNSYFTSKISSADSGMYDIDEDNNFEVKQKWYFKYNAMATAPSSMSNVKLEIRFDYDIAKNGYKRLTY